ncbi:hypothetical protein P171DRAFT_208509 [Karstenula rhodostoma CBS 690.94]|uniref:Secreted protein n=1 Tax=Karstenula rhodostoma CBS 690.94 TaxID=1392251 RepID=A0A9P4PPX1_9PLEO|nr:hypothetical protein P171DRAFT_208509 [Karstenula rhodostoma CBS 690.94]
MIVIVIVGIAAISGHGVHLPPPPIAMCSSPLPSATVRGVDTRCSWERAATSYLRLQRFCKSTTYIAANRADRPTVDTWRTACTYLLVRDRSQHNPGSWSAYTVVRTPEIGLAAVLQREP